jgi:hypothetical protein
VKLEDVEQEVMKRFEEKRDRQGGWPAGLGKGRKPI